MSKRQGAPKKYDYTDLDLEEAADNGVHKNTFINRIGRGFTIEEAKTIPPGVHIKTYYELNAGKKSVTILDKPAPWHLYQYYGMFRKW